MSELNSDTACRITEARLGVCDGGTFGFHFTLSGKGWGVGYTKWFMWSGKAPDPAVMAEAMKWIDGLLRDAKVDSLHKLVGKPAVAFNVGIGEYCKGFRIMTEVV